MVKFVFRLNTIPQPDHAADALAVALCHCNHTEREILSGIGTDKIVQ
jgi:Holliday junction resolvasome RuvABC endonuclease subunit